MTSAYEYQKTVVVKYRFGLHVRPATKLAETANKFRSQIYISKIDSVSSQTHPQTVNAKSIIEILSLAAAPNTELLLRAMGEDAREAVESLVCVLEQGL